MTPSPSLPAGLLTAAGRGESWHAWLDALPLVVQGLADWDLTVDGPATHGHHALVLPVRTADHEPAVLKCSWPRVAARHEHLALQTWHGEGAVLLLRADPLRRALLLERARPTDLGAVDDVEACAIVGGLLARLHRPAPPQLDRLSDAAVVWAARLAALPRSAPVPRRLVEQAASLCRDLARDPATDGTLLHSDVHFGKVLAASREPWLAIGPAPLSGDPHFEPAPLLGSRWAEVLASGDVRWSVRRRLDAVVEALGLDPDRARDWVVVREVVDALTCLESAASDRRELTAADRERTTRAVTVAKAVQG